MRGNGQSSTWYIARRGVRGGLRVASRGAPVADNPRLWLERFPQPLSSDYLSPVHNVAAGFSSAIVSWNAQAPDGAWLDVQLRARLGDRWTTWYDMGHWSTDYTSAIGVR